MSEALAGATVMYVVNTDWFFLSHRLSLALRVRDEGARVVVVAADNGRGQEIRDHGFVFENWRVSRMGRNPVRELAALVRVFRIMRRHRPILVHLVATKALIYGGVAASLARVPVVISAVTGAGYAFGAGRQPWLQVLARGLLRAALSPASTVVFQLEHDRALYESRGIVRHGRTTVIGGVGVDPDEWRVQREPADPVVMLAARMIAEKGVETFVEAARMLQKPFPQARFVLVGPLDLALPTAISEVQLKRWASEGVVEWWGPCADMRAALTAATVFVLPSYHNEGVPRILLEAGATGRSIVASDIPGCRAVLRDGESALLVPTRDAESLAEAVALLLEDAAMRARLAASVRMIIETRFREDDLANQVITLYDRALRSRP